MKIFLIHIIFLLPVLAYSQYPEGWVKGDGYELRHSGFFKLKKKRFYYKIGSMSAGHFHYDYAIRIKWKKNSGLAYDTELSGFVADSPDGKLFTDKNNLYFKVQNGEDVKLSDVIFCWNFNDKTEEFVEQDNCSEAKKYKLKN